MNCMDLFVAALAVGFGWRLSRDLSDKLLEVKPEWSKRKKVLVICFELAFLALIVYYFDTTLLPL